MTYYTRTYNPQPTARVTSQELKNEFQAIDNAIDAVETDVGKGIRAPEATTALPNAASRALKVLSFDASGNPRTTIAEVDLLTTAAADAAVAETTAAAAAAAISEANALSSANAAAMVASPFTSGQTVAVGDVRYSPVDMLTYRAKTAGAHATDPSADATNWARISGNVIQSDLAAVVSPGFVGYFAMNSPPSGYLKANGAAVSRTTYAALFTAIGTTFGAGDGSTTFALPDLRGYFTRGWDDARGIDSGRAFGSNQADSNLSHTHTGSTNTTGAHTHSANTQYTGNGTGNLFDSGRQAYPAATTSAGDHSHTLSINSDGGTESRPKNVALLACIKF